jgi:hypothetical protein
LFSAFSVHKGIRFQEGNHFKLSHSLECKLRSVSFTKSRSSAVSVKTRVRVYRPSVSSRGNDWIYFSSSPRPDQLLGPPSLLSSGYRELLPRGYSDRGVKLISRINLVLRKIRGAIPPLPQYVIMARCLVMDRDERLYVYLLFYPSFAYIERSLTFVVHIMP